MAMLSFFYTCLIYWLQKIDRCIFTFDSSELYDTVQLCCHQSSSYIYAWVTGSSSAVLRNSSCTFLLHTLKRIDVLFVVDRF